MFLQHQNPVWNGLVSSLQSWHNPVKWPNTGFWLVRTENDLKWPLMTPVLLYTFDPWFSHNVQFQRCMPPPPHSQSCSYCVWGPRPKLSRSFLTWSMVLMRAPSLQSDKSWYLHVFLLWEDPFLLICILQINIYIRYYHLSLYVRGTFIRKRK